MSSTWYWFGGAIAAALLLALAWWGWQRGGLALMQLGMSICLVRCLNFLKDFSTCRCAGWLYLC